MRSCSPSPERESAHLDFDQTKRCFYLRAAPIASISGGISGRCPCRGNETNESRSRWYQTRYEEEEAVFSPDGKWIAYHSNDLGEFQVYVTAYPAPSRPVRISTTSGYAAAWSNDGKSILYLSDRKVMTVSLDFAGQEVRPSTPRELFTPPGLGGESKSLDIDRTTGRFLFSTGQPAKGQTLPRHP